MKNEISPASYCREPSAELEFERYGFTEWTGDPDLQAEETFCCVKTPRSKIDHKASLANQARLDAPLDDQHLKELGDDLAKGAKFAAVIGFVEDVIDQIILGEGNHRDELSKLYEWMMVYRIRTKREDVKRWLTKTWNDRHGKVNSEQVRIQHAATEHEVYGLPEEDCARMYKVSRSQIIQELKQRKFNHAFGSMNKASTLHPTVKSVLAETITKGGCDLKLATELTKSAIANPNITANAIKEFTDQYKSCATASEQEAMVGDMENRLSRFVKQSTAGGVIKAGRHTTGKSGRNKSPVNKDAIMVLVDKMLKEIRRPTNGVKLSKDEKVVIKVLISELNVLAS